MPDENEMGVWVLLWSRFIFSSLLKTIFFLIVWSILIFRLCYGCGRYLLQHFNLLALCFVLVFILIFFMASKSDKIMKEIMPKWNFFSTNIQLIADCYTINQWILKIMLNSQWRSGRLRRIRLSHPASSVYIELTQYVYRQK